MNPKLSPFQQQLETGKDLDGMKEIVNTTPAFVIKQRRRCRRLGIGLVHISIYLALVVEHFDSATPKREAA